MTTSSSDARYLRALGIQGDFQDIGYPEIAMFVHRSSIIAVEVHLGCSNCRVLGQDVELHTSMRETSGDNVSLAGKARAD